MEVLEWPGKKDYNHAQISDLKLSSDNSTIGAFKSSGNFTFIRLDAVSKASLNIGVPRLIL